MLAGGRLAIAHLFMPALGERVTPKDTMTSTAKTVFYYSFYMLGMGLGLLFIPNLILGVFGFDATNDVWIRVLGLFTFCAGMLYFYCGRTEQTGFFRISIIERVVFFLGMAGIVLFLPANPFLALIGSVDLLGAIWTALTLRNAS
jgi:hypothetical protein